MCLSARCRAPNQRHWCVARLCHSFFRSCNWSVGLPDSECTCRNVLCRSRTSRWTARLACRRLPRPPPRRQQVAGAYQRRLVAGVLPLGQTQRLHTTKLWQAGPTAVLHHHRHVPCVMRATAAGSVADLHVLLAFPLAAASAAVVCRQCLLRPGRDHASRGKRRQQGRCRGRWRTGRLAYGGSDFA